MEAQTPSEPNCAGVWVDYPTLLAQTMAAVRAKGWLDDAKTMGMSLYERSLESHCKTPSDIARHIGGSMEFQDKSPASKPVGDVRYRIKFDGREPVVFDELQAFLKWIDQNRPSFAAMAERAQLAEAAVLKESSNFPKRSIPRSL